MQPRMMCASFNDNPCTIIISCYSPFNATNKADIITFCNKLSSLVRRIPKHNELIIRGDMIAQIGKYKTKKFCLHNSLNRNREYLTDFSLQNRLTYLYKKKRKRKLWTCTNLNNAKAQCCIVACTT